MPGRLFTLLGSDDHHQLASFQLGMLFDGADFGEVGVAVVVARQGATLDPEAIIAALRQRVANFKVPKRCFVADTLPRNAMGKVLKEEVRRWLTAV